MTNQGKDAVSRLSTAPAHRSPRGKFRGAGRVPGKVLLALLLAACDGGSTGPGREPTGSPGLRIVAGAGTADTIGAAAQPLSVEVADSAGRLRSGVVVRFEPIHVQGRYGPGLGMYVRRVDGSGEPYGFAVDTTDARGRVSVIVSYGFHAGNAGVVITAPTLGYRDTATYTVAPGAPAEFRSLPADTVLYVGESFAFRTAVTDRMGNALSPTVAHKVVSGPAAVSGGTVSATAVGLVQLSSDVAGMSVGSTASVVPRGTVAVYRNRSIFVMELNGSRMDSVGRADGTLAWGRDGGELVYARGGRLYAHELSSGTLRQLVPTVTRLSDPTWPGRSQDGRWVYFNSGSSVGRTRTDGSMPEPEFLVPSGLGRGDPAPSPNGLHVAYTYYPGLEPPGHLRVLELAGRGIRALDVGASIPRWSPSGDEIAYIAAPPERFRTDGELRAVRPDGTGVRRLTRAATFFNDRFDFSPDGKYIVAVTTGGLLEVVVLETGEEIPIRLPAFPGRISHPAWRP